MDRQTQPAALCCMNRYLSEVDDLTWFSFNPHMKLLFLTMCRLSPLGKCLPSTSPEGTYLLRTYTRVVYSRYLVGWYILYCQHHHILSSMFSPEVMSEDAFAVTCTFSVSGNNFGVWNPCSWICLESFLMGVKGKSS